MMTSCGNSKEFVSTSSDTVQLLHVSFAGKDANSSLGVQLINTDVPEREVESMFVAGYAVVGRLLPGDTVAAAAGVHPGDCIVAVNGHGFRRFAAGTDDESTEVLTPEITVDMNHAVVPSGSAYQQLLEKLKAVKAAGGDPPLILSLERCPWDARPNAWGRFLAARDHNVPAAMQMMQEHEAWRETTFPIALQQPGLQRILRCKAVSEIDVIGNDDLPPTVYVNYGKLQQLQAAGEITPEDVVAAFVIFTERMLQKSVDPRHPQTCQFIDLQGVSMTGLRVETLKQIYHAFEPNYPETLYKMVIYPVSAIMVSLSKSTG
jgi:CRAL/TRIO domain